MIAWFRQWLPFTRAARQSLIYVAFVLAAPVLMAALIWAMVQIRDFAGAVPLDRLDSFSAIAMVIAWGLLLVLATFACFISIRAFKLDVKDGTAEITGGDDDNENS